MGVIGLTPKLVSSAAIACVHPLGVQRLSEVPVRVNRRCIRFGVAKHGLADRDVLRRLVRPPTQAVTEAVAAKALAFGNQLQLDCAWFDELAFMFCPHNGCLPSRVGVSTDALGGVISAHLECALYLLQLRVINIRSKSIPYHLQIRLLSVVVQLDIGH